MSRHRFLPGLNTVTAEQHAMDNPGHVVEVTYNWLRSESDTEPHWKLVLACKGCDWWDEQLF